MDWGPSGAAVYGNMPGMDYSGQMGFGANQMAPKVPPPQAAWQNPSSYDPRTALQTNPAYNSLLQYGKTGSGAPAQARRDSQPAMDFYNKSLATSDPLGTANAPQVAFQQAMMANRQADQTSARQRNDASGGMNSMASPAMSQFMAQLGNYQSAGNIGGAANAESAAKIAERSATKNFQTGVAGALSNLGVNLGNMGIADANSMNQANESALGASTSASNLWAQLMSELLGRQLYGGGGGMTHKVGQNSMDYFSQQNQSNQQLTQLLNYLRSGGQG